jgi:hypothetical protein
VVDWGIEPVRTDEFYTVAQPFRRRETGSKWHHLGFQRTSESQIAKSTTPGLQRGPQLSSKTIHNGEGLNGRNQTALMIGDHKGSSSRNPVSVWDGSTIPSTTDPIGTGQKRRRSGRDDYQRGKRPIYVWMYGVGIGVPRAFQFRWIMNRRLTVRHDGLLVDSAAENLWQIRFARLSAPRCSSAQIQRFDVSADPCGRGK